MRGVIGWPNLISEWLQLPHPSKNTVATTGSSFATLILKIIYIYLEGFQNWTEKCNLPEKKIDISFSHSIEEKIKNCVFVFRGPGEYCYDSKIFRQGKFSIIYFIYMRHLLCQKKLVSKSFRSTILHKNKTFTTYEKQSNVYITTKLPNLEHPKRHFFDYK